MDNLSAIMLFTLLTTQLYICTGSSDILCIAKEREALFEIKHHVKDPSNRLKSWAGDGDCCKWAGVFCNNITGHVLELKLSSFPPPLYFYNHEVRDEAYERLRFGGKISPSLLELKHLNHLDLSWNDFEGCKFRVSLDQ